MEYLLVMSISGGVMTGIYWMLWYLLKDRICARLYDLLARVAILYFLLPLPYLKKCYVAVLRFLLPDGSIGISRVPLTWRNHIVHAEGSLHVNDYAGIQTALAIVWMLGVCLLMAKYIVEYVVLARVAARYANLVMTPEQRALLDRLKEQYGIRRRVFLYEASAEETTMTFGFFSPVIVCGRKTTSPEAEYLIRHELVHIRRMDAFWKMLMQMAMMIHWCNPMVWALYYGFDQVCECSCDEIVMQEKTMEEVKEYLRLMIEESREEKTEKTSLRWKSGFGGNKQKMKERMDNLMRRKKWNRTAALALVAALTFANSMTVFAYKDSFHEEMADSASQEEIEEILEQDTVVFVPEGADEKVAERFELLERPDFQSESQFIDEAGNIYPVMEEEGIEPYCDHTFVSGTLTGHRKLSDGGCEVKDYKAQRCSKCGYVIRGEVICTLTYVTCPH